MAAIEKLNDAINAVVATLADHNSDNGDDALHPLHAEKLEDIHKSLCEMLQSAHARIQLGEKIDDMVHEDRGEEY